MVLKAYTLQNMLPVPFDMKIEYIDEFEHKVHYSYLKKSAYQKIKNIIL